MIMSTALLCLASNIYFEARSEPIAGQIAVAEVTLNRVTSQDYPNNICEVVLQENEEAVSLAGGVMVSRISPRICFHS